VGRGLDLHVDAEMMSPQQQQQLFMKSVLTVSDVKRIDKKQHNTRSYGEKSWKEESLEAVSISPKEERSEREIGNAG
jgi:hypothetical protein